MTRNELLLSLPDIILHKSYGYAELEIITDKRDKKGICYRHKNKTASFGTYGLTWLEVHNKVYPLLVKEGYLK